MGLTAWITSGSNSRICFQNLIGGTANLISGYTQNDSDGNRWTLNPAYDAGGLPGAKISTSWPMAASWSKLRISRVTTPSILGRKTSVTIAIRTRTMRFQIVMILRPQPQFLVPQFPALDRLRAAQKSTGTALGSWNDLPGRSTCAPLLQLPASALRTRWWA